MEPPGMNHSCFLKKLEALILELYILAGSKYYQFNLLFWSKRSWFVTHFQSLINKKCFSRRINSIRKWQSLKILQTPLFYRVSIRIFFWNQNWPWRALMLLFSETYDTYVEADKNMLLDVKIYNRLIEKAKIL